MTTLFSGENQKGKRMLATKTSKVYHHAKRANITTHLSLHCTMSMHLPLNGNAMQCNALQVNFNALQVYCNTLHVHCNQCNALHWDKLLASL